MASIVLRYGAGITHGLTRPTFDVDVLYRRANRNHERIEEAMAGINLYYRGAPPELAFRFNSSMIASGMNFTLTSDEGDIDLLGEVAGGGAHKDPHPSSIAIERDGIRVPVLGLERRIDYKRAAGRPKDFKTIAELEMLRNIDLLE